MAKKKTVNDVVFVLDGSGSMQGEYFDTFNDVLNALQVSNVYSVAGDLLKSGKVMFNMGAPSEEAAEKLLKEIGGTKKTIVFLDDCDNSRNSVFFQPLKNAGHDIRVISILGNRFKSLNDYNLNGCIVLYEGMGVLQTFVEAFDQTIVEKTIRDIVNIKPDLRPSAVRKAETTLSERLSEIVSSKAEVDYRVSRLEENIAAARQAVKDNQAAIRKERAQIKSLTTEFAKVEAARDALKAAKPATQAAKKAAPKKKK